MESMGSKSSAAMCSDVQLCVISIALKANAVSPDDVTERKHVSVKENWTEKGHQTIP